MLKHLDISNSSEGQPTEDFTKVTGFASPAEDYIQKRLQISDRLILDSVNTFYFEAIQDYPAFGIREGAVLIVDRSIEVMTGMLLVCFINEKWVVRKTNIAGEQFQLYIGDEIGGYTLLTEDIIIFGVVTWSCLPHFSI